MTLIVPYRDRPDHLQQFLKHMECWPVEIVVVEQAHGKPFNRGKLINIGYLETKPEYFCAHDVDMLPVDVDYVDNNGVTQIASSNIQLQDYLGGVTMFDSYTFSQIGGYHNDYFHRAEDNELMFNLKRLRIFIKQRFGTFTTLPHPRIGPEFIPHLWIKAQQPRRVQDQLSICEYQVTKREASGGYTHIVASI